MPLFEKWALTTNTFLNWKASIVQNFVDQPRIHPGEKIEVFVVLDPVKGYRIACDGLLESTMVEPTTFVLRD